MRNKNLDDIHKKVPANYYQHGIKHNLFQRFWHTNRFKEIKKMIDDKSLETLLDVGSHSGKFTYEISKALPKTKIYGIDISKDAIEYASIKYKNVSFKVAEAESLPFKNNFFDFVTCLEVIEHIQNPKLVITEIRRVLKKGGDVLFLVPSENTLFKLIWYFWIKLGPGKVWNHTHINQFSNYSLDNLLKKNGFKVNKRKKFLFGMLLAIKANKR